MTAKDSRSRAEDMRYVECECQSPNHLMRFWMDECEDYPCVYTDFMLSPHLPLYKRLWLAFEYALRPSKWHGMFDGALWAPEKARDVGEELIAFSIRHSRTYDE